MSLTTRVNSVIEITTQVNILPETTMTTAFRAGDYLAASTVWPSLIKTTAATAAMTKKITHNTDQIVFHFGWFDYGLFAALLGTSALIGVFYGFFSKHKQNNIAEYIFGGRSMKMLPVATSMIASLVDLVFCNFLFGILKKHTHSYYILLVSGTVRIDFHRRLLFLIFRGRGTHKIYSHISGQTLVGIPTEVYTHGTQYVVFVLAAIVVRFIYIGNKMMCLMNFSKIIQSFEKNGFFVSNFILISTTISIHSQVQH